MPDQITQIKSFGDKFAGDGKALKTADLSGGTDFSNLLKCLSTNGSGDVNADLSHMLHGLRQMSDSKAGYAGGRDVSRYSNPQSAVRKREFSDSSLRLDSRSDSKVSERSLDQSAEQGSELKSKDDLNKSADFKEKETADRNKPTASENISEDKILERSVSFETSEIHLENADRVSQIYFEEPQNIQSVPEIPDIQNIQGHAAADISAVPVQTVPENAMNTPAAEESSVLNFFSEDILNENLETETAVFLSEEKTVIQNFSTAALDGSSEQFAKGQNPQAVRQMLEAGAEKGLGETLEGLDLDSIIRQSGNDAVKDQLDTLAKETGVTAVKLDVPDESQILRDTGTLEIDAIDDSIQISKILGETNLSEDSDNRNFSEDSSKKSLMEQALDLLRGKSKMSSDTEEVFTGDSSPKLTAEAAVRTIASQTGSAAQTIVSQTAGVGQTLSAVRGMEGSLSGLNDGMDMMNSSKILSVNESHAMKAESFKGDLASGRGLGEGLSKAEGTREDILKLSENIRKNADAIAEKVMMMAARNMRDLSIDLNPGELGKMKISFNLGSSDEVLKISVAASNPMTKDLVEMSLGRLRENLLQQGIDAETSLGEYHDEHEAAEDRQSKEDNSSGGQTLFASGMDTGDESEDADVITEQATEAENDAVISEEGLSLYA